jgi:hypothetical protein
MLLEQRSKKICRKKKTVGLGIKALQYWTETLFTIEVTSYGLNDYKKVQEGVDIIFTISKEAMKTY